MKVYRVIGLMSGTSLDGIDVALIRTDGEKMIEREAFISLAYEDTLRRRIRQCLNKPVDDFTREVEMELTQAHADAIVALLVERGLSPQEVDLIGFHGQTISHAPDKGETCQIGDGHLLAQLTGIPVVNDFRTADVKSGGQGAPLVPAYHLALAGKLEKPVAFLNIGGVANVTFIGSHDELVAFDTGPGNALIDDWMLAKAGKKYDEDGVIAALGKVDATAVSEFLNYPFFALPAPKSLDRNYFSASTLGNMSLEDGAATITEFTVASIAASLHHLPETPKTWIVTGGGRLNKTIMQSLADRLGAEVISIDELGLNGDAIEAEAFAYLAVRSTRGMPISFPETTGVKQPMTGGQFSFPLVTGVPNPLAGTKRDKTAHKNR